MNQTGLETSLQGRLQFIVRRDFSIDWPRGETATHHILMGFDPDLEAATEIAIREAVEFLQEEAGLTSGEAYAVVSTISWWPYQPLRFSISYSWTAFDDPVADSTGRRHHDDHLVSLRAWFVF